MNTIIKALFLPIYLSAVPVFAQSDFEATVARAEAGDVEAQYTLGLKYDIGSGVTPNISEAIKWYRVAAEQGHALAQLSMGIKYEEGEGVLRSEQEAIKWYTLYAEQDPPGPFLRLSNLQAKRQLATQQQEAQMLSLETQCASFGFSRNTPEMANCLLELFKIANQPQQNTVITNSAPARANSSDTTSGIELMNRGLQILNGVGAPSAPISRTSSCTRIGDFAGQVFTFSGIACPAGYAPAF